MSTGIGTDGVTGITTFLTLSDSTIKRKFKVNDVIKIGTEQLLIIGFDDVNDRYRVIRGHNSTTSANHLSGAIVTRLETEFTYTIDDKLENKNIEFPKIR